MRIEIPGWIYMTPYGTPEKPEYVHREYNPEINHDQVMVCEHTLVVEIPEGFDPVTGMIGTLREKKKKILAKAQMEANGIEEKIQSLLAIENKN